MAVKSQVFSVYFCWEPTEGHSRFFLFVCHSPQIMVMRLLKSGNWHNLHEKINIAKDACLKAAHWNQKVRGMKQGGKRLKGNRPGLTCVQLLCVCVCVCTCACVYSILFEDLSFKNWVQLSFHGRECTFGSLWMQIWGKRKIRKCDYSIPGLQYPKDWLTVRFD